MRINYNVTGPERKKLVQAISEITGEPMNYKGAPTFGYEVGRYHIDKTGVLIGEDNFGLVENLMDLHNFKAIFEEYNSLLSLEFSDPDNLVIEMPAEDFTTETFSNLEKIVASKATLIKKAVGAEALPIERTATKIKFPWFKLKGVSGETEAYTAFISGLCALAKKQKRVTAKERPVENEKYTFRVFLIRLGFVGDDYKAARKLLMKNLSGNSAFRDGTPNKEGGEHDE
jgi:hypothetical protein